MHRSLLIDVKNVQAPVAKAHARYAQQEPLHNALESEGTAPVLVRA